MLQSALLIQPVPPAPPVALRIVRMAESAVTAPACASCSLKGVCLPSGLDGRDLERFGGLASIGRRIRRGDSIHRAGDAFLSLHAVRSGGFKMVGVSRHGDEKITGFHLAGELLGLEAIGAGRHGFDVVALEDSEVCAVPFLPLEKLSQNLPVLQRHLFRLISSEITRDQGLMLLLGGMAADRRLAAFLLSLSRRYQRLGFSADRFLLRMTRDEIGSYLGMAFETVSRLLTRFQRQGMIAVRQREIELKNSGMLRNLVGN
jgi:CRP/FNR family transcriptional regulator